MGNIAAFQFVFFIPSSIRFRLNRPLHKDTVHHWSINCFIRVSLRKPLFLSPKGLFFNIWVILLSNFLFFKHILRVLFTFLREFGYIWRYALLHILNWVLYGDTLNGFVTIPRSPINAFNSVIYLFFIPIWLIKTNSCCFSSSKSWRRGHIKCSIVACSWSLIIRKHGFIHLVAGIGHF